MDALGDRNIEFIEVGSEEKIEIALTDALLGVHVGKPIPKLLLSEEPEVAQQLSALYSNVSRTGQNKFRKSIISITKRWLVPYKAHQINNELIEFLFQLLWLIALINLYEVIPTLIGSIRKGILESLRESDPSTLGYRILGTLIVISDYDTNMRIRPFFERAFFEIENRHNDGIDYRHVHQLFIGLCKLNPDGWKDYFLQFISIAEKYPQCEALIGPTLVKFAELVGLYGVWKQLKSTPKHDELTIVFRYLCDQSWSPFAIRPQPKHRQTDNRRHQTHNPIVTLQQIEEDSYSEENSYSEQANVAALYLTYSTHLGLAKSDLALVLFEEKDPSTLVFLHAIYPNLVKPTSLEKSKGRLDQVS